MRISLIIILCAVILSCNTINESEQILDQKHLGAIEYLVAKTKNDSNFERSNERVNPVLKVFKEEIVNHTDLSAMIYSKDTLLANRKFSDQYLDSIYLEIKDPGASLVRKKESISNLLHVMHFMSGYCSFYCNTERIQVILQDTVYYPRNRKLPVMQVLVPEISDTLHKKGVVSYEHYKESNLKEISTYTKEDFIKSPLQVQLRNPVTKESRTYSDTLVIAIVD